jgi:hypothetical protein
VSNPRGYQAIRRTNTLATAEFSPNTSARRERILPHLPDLLNIPELDVDGTKIRDSTFRLIGTAYGDGIHFLSRQIRVSDLQVFEEDGLGENPGRYVSLNLRWSDMTAVQRSYAGQRRISLAIYVRSTDLL